MSRFAGTPVVWPVIHVESAAQALANAELAFEQAVAGVFLIQMQGRDELLGPIAQQLKTRWPQRSVGVNFLSLPADTALQRSLSLGLDATWTDKPGVRSDRVLPVAWRVQALLERASRHLFFGSVAFKYQEVDSDPGRAAVLASKLGMIPTTSGEATGVAPAQSKLQTMHRSVEGAALAVASGITPENILSFAPYLSHVLVATGIAKDFHNLDADRLRLLLQVLGLRREPPF